MKIVDDACHALGTSHIAQDATRSFAGQNAFCDLSVFSFHPVKAIAMGEGGAVTANDPDLAARLARLRNHGMTREDGAFRNTAEAFDESGHANPWYYELPEPGFNWRANDMQCALGLSQLSKIERFLAARRALAAQYDALLAPFAPRLRPVARTRTCLPALHLYAALIDFAACGVSRAETMRRLAEAGIGTQVHYFPVHRQPYYASRFATPELHDAERYYARVLSLPFFASMTREDPPRVVEVLTDILGL